MNSKSTTLKEQLMQGKTVSTYTSGVSMEPLLYDHQTIVFIQSIFLENGGRRHIEVGDLPIYLRPDGKYVIHRLVKEDDEFYYTRGDNCLKWERIPKDWVLGIVTGIYRNGKNIEVTDQRYRRYVHFWMAIYPVRAVYYRIRGWKNCFFTMFKLTKG